MKKATFYTNLLFKFLDRIKILVLFLPLTFFLTFFREPSYFISSFIFLRLIALIYFIAFLSITLQIESIAGSKGILPIQNLFNSIKELVGGRSFLAAPTLFWFNSKDKFLKIPGIIGMILALILLTGFLSKLILLILFILYLSYVIAGQEFLSFQWDRLLLETGFIAIFINPTSNTTAWLFLWILFRLMFMSGFSKLESKDKSWRNLEALNHHLETSPLPTPGGYIMQKFPGFFKKFSVAMTLVIESFIPFLIFIPGIPSYIAAFLFLSLQLFIWFTGNYGIMNLLSIALGLFLLDDKFFEKILSNNAFEKFYDFVHAGPSTINILFNPISILVAGFVIIFSTFSLYKRFGNKLAVEIEDILQLIEAFRIINIYEPFTTIRTKRQEIIIEGSMDGKTWKEYEFKYKPDNPKKPLLWLFGHMPRVDYQMWVASNTEYQYNPWFINFMQQIALNSKPVLKVFRKNPFKSNPPIHLRATLYEYNYSKFKDLRKGFKWWERNITGYYFPEVTLKRTA